MNEFVCFMLKQIGRPQPLSWVTGINQTKSTQEIEVLEECVSKWINGERTCDLVVSDLFIGGCEHRYVINVADVMMKDAHYYIYCTEFTTKCTTF